MDQQVSVDLPADVWAIILRNLDDFSLLNALRSSSFLLNVSCQDPVLKKRIPDTVQTYKRHVIPCYENFMLRKVLTYYQTASDPLSMDEIFNIQCAPLLMNTIRELSKKEGIMDEILEEALKQLNGNDEGSLRKFWEDSVNAISQFSNECKSRMSEFIDLAIEQFNKNKCRTS